MIGLYILLGGMALFAGVITAWDLIAQRENRKSQPRTLSLDRSLGTMETLALLLIAKLLTFDF